MYIVKQFVGVARSNESDDLIGLANELYDSDIDKMASDINDFFNSVSGDIPPLDESILKTLDVNDYEDMFIIYPWQVEQKLYFVHIKQLDLTAFQIGSLKKCLRLSPSQFVQYSTPLLHKVTYQTYGDRLMSYQYRRSHHRVMRYTNRHFTYLLTYPNQLTVTLDRYHSLPL